MILSDKHTAALNVMEKDLSSYAIGISPFKESGERTAEEPICNEYQPSNSTRCSDSSQEQNSTKFMASDHTLAVSSSNSTCIDEVGDCNSSGGSSLVPNSCREKSSDVLSVSPALELDRARYCCFHAACEGDDNKQDLGVGDVKFSPLDIELEIEKSKHYEHFSPQKEALDLSSSSTISTSMAPEEGYLDYAPQNLVHGEAELSSLNNVEEQEDDSQCGMQALSRTSKKTSRTGDSREMSMTLVDSNQLGSKPIRIAPKSVFSLEEEEDMDALEIARQVAIEVELEVVGYREHFINSPDLLCGEATVAQSTDLVDGILKNNSQLSDCIIDRVCESPIMMPVAEEQNLEIENTQYGFDLNEDVYKGEIGRSASRISTETAKFSTPIVVFASKGVPRFPLPSVQFDSESGWRGYSATSAFRPVSRQKIPDSEKAPDVKQKSNFLEFDLNVAETQDDYFADSRQISISSDHLSRKSFMEVNSRKEKKLKLDLNHFGYEDISVKHLSNYRFQHHYVNHSFPVASSSSSSKQHYMRDFDLNDNPTTLLDAADSYHHIETTSKSFHTCRSSKPDDLNSPVDRKPCKSHSQCKPFLNNGGLMHYSQISSAYGYNVLKAEAAIPIPPTVLHRGATLMPLGLSGSFPTVTRLAPYEEGRRYGEANFNHMFTHNGKLEENLRSLQSSGSLVLKRKEPESRLEGYYPLGYKEMPFWN